MLTAKEIRQSFKDFFEKKGHRIVPSAPMVIKDDPIDVHQCGYESIQRYNLRQ